MYTPNIKYMESTMIPNETTLPKILLPFFNVTPSHTNYRNDYQ